MNWHVQVQGEVIEIGVQLDFTPQAWDEDDPFPDLAGGDGLTLELPNNDRLKGLVTNRLAGRGGHRGADCRMGHQARFTLCESSPRSQGRTNSLMDRGDKDFVRAPS